MTLRPIQGEKTVASAFGVLHAHDLPVAQSTLSQVHRADVVYPHTGYRDIMANDGAPAVIAREVADALALGAVIAVRHDGKTPGLERSDIWALFAGADNSLKATLFKPASHGHVHWPRVRDVDVAELARHGGSFGIVQPYRPERPHQVRVQPQEAPRVYPEPLATRGAPVAIDEAAALRELESIIARRYSRELDSWDVYDLVRDYASSIEHAPTTFHAVVVDRLVEAMPSTVGAAMQGGAIPGADKRLAIAKHLALHDTSYLAQDMRSFCICNPDDRADIARLVVAMTGSRYMLHIEDGFDLTDPAAGARIDALAAKRDRELAASKSRSEKH